MSHDNDRTGQSSYHTCSFNTVGECSCGAKMVMPKPSTTAIDYDKPHLNTPIVELPDKTPLAAKLVLADDRVNMGSPIGPGFVVYERAKGELGYDRPMALAAVGKGWHVLINNVFDRVEWDQKHHQGRFLGSLVITQVKEKFGTLRMYHYCNNDPGYADGYMSAIESLSGKICEECGKPGTIGGRGWVRTLCDECRKGTEVPCRTEQTPDA